MVNQIHRYLSKLYTCEFKTSGWFFHCGGINNNNKIWLIKQLNSENSENTENTFPDFTYPKELTIELQKIFNLDSEELKKIIESWCYVIKPEIDLTDWWVLTGPGKIGFGYINPTATLFIT